MREIFRLRHSDILWESNSGFGQKRCNKLNNINEKLDYLEDKAFAGSIDLDELVEINRLYQQKAKIERWI